MQTYQERLDEAREQYETQIALLKAENQMQPTMQHWADAWSLQHDDPKDDSKRYSLNWWDDIRLYMAEKDTTKCLNLFLEKMEADPNISSVKLNNQWEKHIVYNVETNFPVPEYSWRENLSFTVYIYFDRSKFCHAKVAKIEHREHTYEDKTYQLVCA